MVGAFFNARDLRLRQAKFGAELGLGQPGGLAGLRDAVGGKFESDIPGGMHGLARVCDALQEVVERAGCRQALVFLQRNEDVRRDRRSSTPPIS